MTLLGNQGTLSKRSDVGLTRKILDFDQSSRDTEDMTQLITGGFYVQGGLEFYTRMNLYPRNV